MVENALWTFYHQFARALPVIFRRGKKSPAQSSLPTNMIARALPLRPYLAARRPVGRGTGINDACTIVAEMLANSVP
jgi:hypothetical protein